MAKRKAVDYHKAAELLRYATYPNRLQVLLILADGEQNVGAMCERIGRLSLGALSIHLAPLRLGGIIDRRRQGQNNFYSLTDRGRRLVEAARPLTERG